MSPPDRSHLEAALRERGLRMTSQRRRILDVILASEDHLTAESIYATSSADHPKMNISTVYRTLEALTDANLAYHHHIGHGMSQWHLAHGTETHVHLVCDGCGVTTDVPFADLSAIFDEIEANYHFTPDPRHFAIGGQCRDCRR